MSEPTKLERLAELAYKFACDVKIGTDKDLLPMFVIERGDEREVIGAPYRTLEEKRIMIANIAIEIAEKGASAWSFLSDTWFAHRAKGESFDPPPSEDPKRQEGVWCLTSDGQDTFVYTWKAQRDQKGNYSELVKMEGSPHRANSWISVALNRAMKLHEEFPV